MNKLSLYWNYSTRSLVRGGQRTLLAIFCIAVGVMAIVALQIVGDSISKALTSNVVEANGGDLKISSTLIPLGAKDITYFDSLKSKSDIKDYATDNTINAAYTHADGNTDTFEIIAVSNNFPLVGQANFTQPSTNLRIQDVVKGTDVIINQRLIDAMKVSLNDTVTIKLEDGRVLMVHVAGIYKDGGAFRGQQILISDATVNATLSSSGKAIAPAFTDVYTTVDSSKLAAVKKEISQQYQTATISTAQDQLKQQESNISNIRFFLQIVGLLALFIGGIGIINTMQVLLRRRRTEIAMLKTSGYQQGDLYAMFGLEAGLLGLIGGAVGTILGVVISSAVASVIGRVAFIQLPIEYNPATIVSGLYIGLATAVIFGLLPIIQASQVRPLAVLRESEETSRGSFFLTAGLLVLLSVLFVALASTILGDFGKAVVAVYGGALLLAALATGFGVLVVSISRLPVYEKPSPRILLWVLIAIGGLVGSVIATALLFGAGLVFTLIANKAGLGSVSVFGTVAFGSLGLILLGGSIIFFVATIVDVLVMFFPLEWKTAVMLAYRNIGRNAVRTTTTLTALFVGVFAIGLVLVLGQGIKDTINTTIANLSDHNVYVFSPSAQAASITSNLSSSSYVTQSKTIANLVTNTGDITITSINGQDFKTVLAADTLKGYEDGTQIGQRGIITTLGSLQGYDLSNAQSSSVPPSGTDTTTGQKYFLTGTELSAADAGTTNANVSALLRRPPLNLKLGDTFVIASRDGSISKTLTITGFYNDQTLSTNFGQVWVDNSVVNDITSNTAAVVFQLKVNPDHVNDFRKALNASAPGAVVFAITDVTALVNQLLNNIIVMLTGIASLAMIAGLIIIANAVALAMLERRREIGILKTVGYSTTSVLSSVLVENGLIGLLGSLVAMTLVGGLITILNTTIFKSANIPISGALIVIVVIATAAVTMIIAALVAYDAARVRPLQVLRYE